MNKQIQNLFAILALAILVVAEYPKFSDEKPDEGHHVPEIKFFPQAYIQASGIISTMTAHFSYQRSSF